MYAFPKKMMIFTIYLPADFKTKKKQSEIDCFLVGTAGFEPATT